MPRNSSGDARLANRLLILQLRQLEPELGVMALSRRVGVSESTVRSVLSKFGGSDISVGVPQAHRGAGRQKSQSKRWERCAIVLFTGFTFIVPRHLLFMVKKKPGFTAAQLAEEMYEWEKRSILARPRGAVATIPQKYSKQTIGRYF